MKRHNSYLFNPLIGNFLCWFIAFMLFTLTEYFNGNFAWIYGRSAGPIVIAGTLIGSFWTIRLHAYREAERIEIKRKTINHSQRIMVRALLAIVVGMTIHIVAEGFHPTAYARGFACALYIGGVFWLIFDSYLNYDRGKEPFYVSSWYKSARVDRWFSRLGSPVLWLASKVLVYIATYYFYAYTMSEI